MVLSVRGRSLLAVALTVAVFAGVAIAWTATHRGMTDEEQGEAREAAVELLTRNGAAGRMPSDLTERAHAFKTEANARRDLLATVWAPSVLDEVVSELEAAWRPVLRDRGYLAYSDNRFVVTKWHEAKQVRQGVQVVMRGHMEYKDAASGQWHGSADGTEHLTLTSVEDEWRLLDERVEDYNPS
ncbi:MAG: hypothetical protein NTX33_11635 [Propionibacteriales bacterium]|nr:hypothetical protein [Propionibacteriales bacterium]